MSDLLRCPFCGGEARLLDDYGSEKDGTMYRVWHDCDGYEGKSAGYGYPLHLFFETPWYPDAQMACDAWNRRV